MSGQAASNPCDSPIEQARACGCGPSRRARRVAYSLVVVTLATLAVPWAWTARGQDGRETVATGAPDSCALFDHSHAAWTSLLQRHVSNGAVDYGGLKKASHAELDAYLSSLQSVCRGHFDTWTREQKLAFWINAYNAYTVKLILDHYPLKSIRTIGLLPGAAFRESFIPLRGVRGKTLSLNDIEHEILRREFREPRIHFAIVCASVSCPVLRSEAYRAADLEQQLDDAARTFVRDSSKNRFDARERAAHLSAIFDWFREDFVRDAKSLPAFVARYADAETAAAISSGKVRVEFLDYDWSLNGR